MTMSDTVTTPTIPPPQEQHSHHKPPPQNPLNSNSISTAPPSPPPPRVSMEDYVNSYGILTNQIEQREQPSSKNLDTKEKGDNRFQKYETELKQYLLAKYFSGDGMFEKSTMIDDATIKSSRWACVRWYADPEILDGSLEQCVGKQEQVEEELEEEDEEDEESIDSP